MAKIFEKVTTLGNKNTVLLEQRQANIYAFPYDDWNTIRFGGFYSFTDNIDYNSTTGFATQAITVGDTADRYFIGAKSNIGSFPGVNDDPFVGHAAYNSTCTYNPNAFNIGELMINDVSPLIFHSNGTFSLFPSGGYGNYQSFGSSTGYASDTNFARFVGFMLQIENKGLSNQKLHLYYNSNMGEYSDVSDESIKSALIGSSYAYEGSLDWNLAGTPYSLPDSIFSYSPFTTARLRIHNLAVQKLS